MDPTAPGQSRNRANDIALAAARVDMIADDVARLRDRYSWVLEEAQETALGEALAKLRGVVADLYARVRP